MAMFTPLFLPLAAAVLKSTITLLFYVLNYGKPLDWQVQISGTVQSVWSEQCLKQPDGQTDVFLSEDVSGFCPLTGILHRPRTI